MTRSPLTDRIREARHIRSFEPIGELLRAGYWPTDAEWLEIYALPINGGRAPSQEIGETLERKQAMIAHYKNLRKQEGIISSEDRIQKTADAFNVHHSLVRYLTTKGDPRIRKNVFSEENSEEVD